MKVIILALIASLAIGGAFGDEKESAINEINMKYKELFVYAHSVTAHIQAEMKQRLPNMVNETLDYGKELMKNTLQEFADEVKKVSRTAVVKGKPSSTFECLAKASLEGRQQILDIQEEFIEEVNNVVYKRESKLELSLISAGLILNAVTELKDQAIKNIEKADSGFKSLKEEAIKRIETGTKQLASLESSVQNQSLKSEYIAVKQAFAAKFKEVKESLFKRLQRC